jgi:4-hydroxybenzoate polyprenyltransferase
VSGEPQETRAGVAASAPRRTWLALLRSTRPRQWTKNLIVFAALIFSGNLRKTDDLVAALAAFVLYCGLSGAIYVFNDIKDLERDRLSMRKRWRPLAAGLVTVPVASVFAGVLAAACLGGSFALGLRFGLVAVAYVALQVLYTLALKHEVILDAMSIAAGFVLRVVAGAVAVEVSISSWLLLCAALLALFLALAKRRYELLHVEDARDHRPSLAHYTAPLLDLMLATVTAATIVFYSLYTFFSHASHVRPYMMATVPFVAYGLFRYLYLVHLKQLGGSPEEVMLTDLPLILDIVLWTALVVVALYIA